MKSKIAKLLAIVMLLQACYVPGIHGTEYTMDTDIQQLVGPKQVETTTPPAYEVVEPEAVSSNVFDYGLFAGNERANLEFSGYTLDVEGNVRSNNGIRTNCQDLRISGSCEASGELQTYGTNIEIGQQVTGVPTLQMPDFYDEMIGLFSGIADVYDGDLMIDQSHAEFKMPAIIHGDATFNNVALEGTGSIFADRHITLNMYSLSSQNNSRVFYYSKEGNITINAAYAKLNGIIYAPNGTVTFNGYDLELNGRIIADRVILNGSMIKIKTDESDLELLNKPPTVDAGSNQEVDLMNKVELKGLVADDGLLYTIPDIKWQKVDGPGEVTFDNHNQASTQASFSEEGTYILELSVFDGQYTRKDTVRIDVISREYMIYKTYTSTEDFAQGKTINLADTIPNQLQLDEETKPFNFIWVAVSSKGTVVKIDTDTGEILGEYRTAPQGQALNPSRTTVDKKGNVWVANRDGNSVTRIGLEENGQWIDKNGNGICDTSTGLGDVRAWTNKGGADTSGGVSTAEDECIITYVRTSSPGTRHVSVDGNNDVWVSGTGNRVFDLIDGDTGEIKRTEGPVGYGGYGGLIDKNGVIWSANPFLRWDTSTSLNRSEQGKGWTTSNHYSYGLGIDPEGNIWNTGGSLIHKFAPDGKHLGTFSHGGPSSQGCAVDQNGDIWVSHSSAYRTLSRLKNDGTWVGNITLPSGATGVAVDANNKIWATCMNKGVVVRIDPTKGKVGEIDYTTPYLGGTLYNYSDMTGSTLYGMPEVGTWTTVYDSEQEGVEWGKVVWNGQRTNDGSLRVYVETSEDGVKFSKQQEVTNGSQIDLPRGRYIKLNVEFRRSSDGKSPILTDITVTSNGYDIPLKANDVPEITVDNYLKTNMTQALELNATITDDLLPTSDPMAIGWTKVSGPGEVTFEDATKAVTTAQFSEEGTYVLAVQVTDGANQRQATVKVDVTKTPIIIDEELPVVHIDLSKETAQVGEDVSAIIYATDNIAISELKVWINGEEQLLEPQIEPYEFVLKGNVPKIYQIEVKAVDTSGNESRKEALCKIVNTDDTTKPIVAITSPANGSSINEPVEIIGTAMDAEGLLYYELQYQKQGEEQSRFITFVKDPMPHDNRSLGVLDPSQLEKGTYIIRLIAYDKGGNSNHVDVQYEIEEMLEDKVAPQITIKMSKDKADVGELVEASIQVLDNRNLQSVAIYKDDVLLEEIKDFEEGINEQSATLSFSEIEAKIVTIKVVATDRSGNTNEQISECSIIDTRDKIPPTVQLILSALDGNIRGNVAFSGTAQDDNALERYMIQVKRADEDEAKFVTLFEGNTPKVDEAFGVWDSRQVEDGIYDFKLTVQDKGGWIAYQTIQGRIDNTAPTVHITFSKDQASVGEEIVATIEVADNIHVAKVAAYVNDELILESAGTITFRRDQPETITVRVVATDLSGNVTEVSKSCDMIDNRDPQAPVVDIQTPIHGSKITQPTKIVGTVRDNVGIKDYKLEYRPKDVEAYTLLAEGNTEKLSEVLGVFDPTNLEKGIYEIRLTATDVSGWTRWISIFYDVTDDTGQGSGELILNLNVSQITATVGEPVEAHVYIEGTAEVAKLELYIDGVLTHTVDGKVNFTSEIAKTVSLTAIAETVSGSSVLVTNECQFVAEQGEGQGEVIFGGPERGTSITAPTAIIGTANDNVAFASYKLQYRKATDTAYTTFAEETVPKINEVLGVFDPTLLENGIYNVRLVVTDQAGNTTTTETHYIVEGEMKIGHMGIGFTDIIANVAGIDMSIDRFYDSRNKTQGDFGVGWRLGLSNMQLFESTPMAHGWEQVQSSGGIGASYQIIDTAKHYVTVTLGDGSSETFDVVLGTSQQPFVPIVTTTVNFQARGKSGYKLEVVGSNNVLLSQRVGPVDFIGDATAFFFEPVRYKLTTKEGTEVIIHKVNGVESMKDNKGNTIAITKDGIIHSGGKSILFERDAQGRIIKATDLVGKVTTYAYDAQGNLVAVTNPINQTIQFTYGENHFLKEIVGPDGKPVARNEYDADGRLIASIDASGNRVEYDHDIEGRQNIIRDKLGNQTLYTYNDQGKILQTVDPLGNKTSFVYDDKGNCTSLTNASGETIYYEYDEDNNIVAQYDARGNKVLCDYDTEGRAKTITDKNGMKLHFEYDSQGNMTTIRDEEGNVTRSTYDAQGRITQNEDAIGSITQYTYDGQGNLRSETDPLGNTTFFNYDEEDRCTSIVSTRTNEKGEVEQVIKYNVYDEMGRIIETVDPRGNRQKNIYNDLGQVEAVIDQEGHKTRFEYDERGNQIRIIYSDQTEEVFEYNAGDQLIKAHGRDGKATTFEYDKVGRLLKMINPEGTYIENVYNEIGNVVEQYDEARNKTTFTYDSFGRKTSVTNALGHVIRYQYTNAMEPTTIIDPNGYATHYAYNKRGLCERITFADGTSIQMAYDALGRMTQVTDEEGYVTRYTYDANNAIKQVMDATGSTTTYNYDELGALVEVIDAEGKSTKYAYDLSGQMTKRTLPMGMFEEMAYDERGNLISRIDFNGNETTYSYDAMNRLQTKTYADGTKESYAYNTIGQIKTITDARGRTSYEYDYLNRLKKQQNPDGTWISYAYDTNGNITKVTTSYSETSYTHDALGRIDTVTDSKGQVYTYTYDKANYIKSIDQANGVKTKYTYDKRYRLKKIEHLSPQALPIESYEYTYSPKGLREEVKELNGTVVNYTYDELGRLIGEIITTRNQDQEEVILSTSYTYDKVSNRITQVKNGITTQWTYDENDRLLSDGNATYTYDANGNLLEKRQGEEVHTYSYDYEDRQIKSITPGEAGMITTTYSYDTAGIRVGKKVNGRDETRYLVDSNVMYPRIIDEIAGDGTLLVSYTYGNKLLAQTRGEQTRYYHGDHIGSIRFLTDDTGEVTDRYSYDAFGNTLSKEGTTIN
ncbi:MAG: PKD domain-containing protein, partial [Cellulosilyticaceae bacterium]